MPDIYEIASAFRASLLNRERAAASTLVRQYGLVWTRLQTQLDKLTQQIEAARARGDTVDRAWLVRQERYHALLKQVSREVRRFAAYADRSVTAGQQQAIDAALRQSQTLMAAATGADTPGIAAGFNKLPSSAVEHIVGFAGDGSPLKGLLDKLGPDASQRVADALVDGVARGIGPAQIAARVREALGGNLARALTIARTETLRAYREASRQTYAVNDDVLDGWMWRSARDRRTCPVCWALDGTIHSNDEPLGSHPNCRCVQLPVVIGSDVAKRAGRGVDVFAKLSQDEQQEVLGLAKFAAYKAGNLPLQNLVGYRRDPQWGPVRWERSLIDASKGHIIGAIPEPRRSTLPGG